MAELRKSAAAYLLAVCLSLAFLYGALEFWRADLTRPLLYFGDALLTQSWVKGVVENGWYSSNPSLGAPFGLELHDFPNSDGLFFAMLSGLSLFSSNYALVYNLYYFLTFPLAAVSALYVFRRFGAPRAPALVGSLLFAVLPYHFLRGEAHLFLASYFLVPLSVMLVAGLYLDLEPRPRFLTSAVLCLLIGSGGVYYAFFTCYFLLIAGASASLWKKRSAPLWRAVIGVALVCSSVLANTAPRIVYGLSHGPNPSAVVRDPAQAEYYGLKLAQMLLPVSGHRVPALARLRASYDQALAPLVNENAMSALGLAGSAGFSILIAGLLRPRSREKPTLVDGLVLLNCSAVLLATFGGFGTLFGFLVSPWIRGYNRMSVFIAFFSLFAIVLALSKLGRLAKRPVACVLYRFGLATVLFVGVLDQTSTSYVPDYPGITSIFVRDDEFVRQIEDSLPPRAMVFQLPYCRYPEPPVIREMQTYEHLRPYLHSRSIRWSYGAMSGRYSDLWAAQASEEPAGELVRRLALAGFGGIYIDRAGFADKGALLESELVQTLDVEPLVSGDGRFLFFELHTFTEAMRREYTTAAWARARESALSPVVACWSGGFHDPEDGAVGTRRWSDGSGALTLVNPSKTARRVDLAMTLATKDEGPSWIKLKGRGFEEQFPVDGSDKAVRATVVIPPGRLELRFFANGRRIWPEGENRTLVFRVDHFAIHEAASREDRPEQADIAREEARAVAR